MKFVEGKILIGRKNFLVLNTFLFYFSDLKNFFCRQTFYTASRLKTFFPIPDSVHVFNTENFPQYQIFYITSPTPKIFPYVKFYMLLFRIFSSAQNFL